MEEKLPESVDVVVLGTGLPEAILASACSRAGMSVLHLDRNEYYGGDWSSFTMSMVHEVAETKESKLTPEDVSRISDLLQNENEKLVELGDRKVIDDIEMTWQDENMKEKLEELGQMRRFSIDLVPKVLLSKGNMVQTLCDSQVSHYAEFKLVNRQLCPSESPERITLNPVPCSKGEIFQSSVLTMLEKRALMKFITFCTHWSTKAPEERREALGDHVDRPFSEFLAQMGVSEALQAVIIHTIGILQTRPTALSGMTSSCEFMDSVGFYGPSPFLFPLYGCGELSQCFCRLAAVFGSLYCLGRPVQALVKENGRITAVIANNERINCRHVIMSSRFVPEDVPIQNRLEIDRIVFATDKSIKEAEKEQITLLNLASLRPEAEISRVIEAGFEACTAPKGHFLVHATGTREGGACVDEILERIFRENDVHPYWKMSFTANSMKFDAGEVGENVICAPPVDANIHYSSVIEECRQLFCATWPDLDFLPRKMKKEEEEEEEEEEKEEDD
uniref:Rab proteins geranylgeranyltransferase component A n=1 Tax=Caenorhabditis tropicalis TaxID=1561998 RepID=A0A1I7UXD1_9PELO